MRLDLNSPEFQDVLFGLESAELRQVISGLRRMRAISWDELYRHTGFRWEAIEHLKAPNGAKVHSLRLSQRIRAIGYRDGELLRLISLHPDHDSAYGGWRGASDALFSAGRADRAGSTPETPRAPTFVANLVETPAQAAAW